MDKSTTLGEKARLAMGMPLVLACAVAALSLQAGSEPAVKPLEARKLGICLSPPRPGEVGRYCDFIRNRLAKDGFDTLVMVTRYRFRFARHPECAAADALGRDDVRRIAAACREAGLTLIPKMNLLGHQTYRKMPLKSLGGPLLAHPDMDESRGRTNIRHDYCRSLCPTHPGAQKLVFELMDELVDACGARAVHIGCDEVFEIARCERCAGIPTAKLFADWVNALNRHNRARGVETLIWADRLLDSAKTPYGVWEASDSGTAAALGLLDRDIVLCDWHYKKCDAYPSVETFGEAGFKMWVCPWRSLENARLFVDYANRHERGGNLQGILLTTWCSFANVADVIEGKPFGKGMDKESAHTLRGVAEIYRAYKRRVQN